ncbi:MAG TPA: hypothetical protein VFC19_31840 [Candidatus Limnocylindrales bacterium]|nr:hypothetical protein [Candidatus Limnocylindrales bacterium]
MTVTIALIVATVTPATGARADTPAPCTVELSHLVNVEAYEDDVAFRDLNHAVLDNVAHTLGAPNVKERVSEQLRRGLIGTVADPVTRTVTVVTTPELKNGVNVTGAKVITGCHSAADLIDAENVLTGRLWHPDAVRAAFSYSLQAGDSRYHINFDSRYPQAAAALREKLGDRAVVTLGAAGRAGRLDDGRPHFGGAGLREGPGPSYTNTCTAAFSVRRNASDGQYGSVTAGHCFGESTYVYSGPKYYGFTWGRWGFPGYDILGIRSGAETYDNVIHVDPCCPSTRTVVGRFNAQVGDFVCFSGMVSRALCSIRITSTNGVFCDWYGCTYGLIEAIRSNSVFMQPGDSGAPIYIRGTNNVAYIGGMAIASAAGGTIAYGESIATIEGYLAVTLMTW